MPGRIAHCLFTNVLEKVEFSEVVRYALITPTQQEIHPLWGMCSPSRAATLPSFE
jgi:hypothetical protein